MPWPFSSTKAAPAPTTLSSSSNLCLKFVEWKCKNVRAGVGVKGSGTFAMGQKRSCYCYVHTCQEERCVNVVAGPKQSLCAKHQIKGIMRHHRRNDAVDFGNATS